MMGSRINKDSHHIMHLIQPDTIGAEVGVWWGNTSYNFFMKNLKHLYLVDPWSVEPYKGTTEFEWEEYLTRYEKVTKSNTEEGFQKYYEKVYEDVMRRFDPYENVTVCRQTSDDFFKEFKGDKLDWIYLDGSHAYEGVQADLENSLKIVKPGGLILGDDYKWGQRFGKPGVTKAIKEFKEKYNLKVRQHGVVQFEIKVPE
jgi:hypothetical protein